MGYLPLNSSPYCPVSSFESILHPQNRRLWRRPLDSFTDALENRYANSPLGGKKLCGFMSQLRT
ncbi:hypothetical protein KUTeg_022219 [Tegillarca granosa]|uniref:Uncharacterized protein n=1 Tax=Tegillarca granosa TaxID=220873 RepID=A0ABQ9EB14_TEGGR|nr:hypothetical protein KUTeg_022219 [Tegillarca granosa]